ncbi:hypothetical protein DFH11DRAFT_858824 [Phellopilus nigrolimitatus]|nr:hypothetical protein DFH11DRAFT_858824 [Phellopilus nigrolimitatus]
MAPKEPTRQQLSSRLAYSQSTPAFLQRLKNNIAGVADDEDTEFDEWEASGSSGRPPIPRRPSPPQRPDDDPGSADEDDGDEKPQVVVLKEGKHMTEREAENAKRRARGLSPLPERSKTPEELKERDDDPTINKVKTDGKDMSSKSIPLSFSSSGPSGAKNAVKKRKVIGDDLDQLADKEKLAKKVKKASKVKKTKAGTLLSFGDENDG